MNFSALINLYPIDLPNHPILFAALERRILSTVLADDPESPRKAAIRTPDGITFFTPESDEAFVRGSLRKLQLNGPIMAILREPDGRFPKPDIIIPRYEFRSRNPGSAVRIPDIPEGFSICQLDEELIAGCEWRTLIELSYGTKTAFLSEGYGFLLVNGTNIVTETYAAFFGAGGVEVGVITPEAYRGRGYATIAAAHLISKIEDQGFRPYWSCDQSNAGSVAVAKKLGFTERGDYMIYGYRPLKVPELNNG